MRKTVVLKRENLRKLYWDENLSIPLIAQRYNLNPTSVLKRMKKNNISRRSLTEANYNVNRNKPKFRLRLNLNYDEEKLKIAGIMLYWAEGFKGGAGIDFTNSDPLMIKIFLKFLRQICGINETRLRIYLYAYEHQKIDDLKIFWSNLTHIPLRQFSRPFIRKGNANLSERKMPYGLVHVRYYDKRLLEVVLKWVKEYLALLNIDT